MRRVRRMLAEDARNMAIGNWISSRHGSEAGQEPQALQPLEPAPEALDHQQLCKERALGMPSDIV